MRPALYPWIAGLFVALVMLVVPGTSEAKAEHVHGLVLAVTPKDGTAIIRHDAFDSMPSMTMPFQIIPRSKVATLQAGNTIDATVDTSTEPWTLKNVTVSTTEPVTQEQGDPLRRVTPLKVGDTAPDTAFVDQTGKAFKMSDLRGQDVLLAFVYTRCQDARMCPLISAKFHAVQQRIGARKMHLVEVTLDPSYDRPDVLARYGKLFGAEPKQWTLAVGDAEPTLDFAAKFGITAFPDPTIGIIHAENTVEIDPEGRIRSMITETSWQPDEIIADVDNSRGEASNPIARLNLWLSRAAVAMCGNNVAAFSGLADIGVVLLIVASFGYLLFRLARGIAKSA
jgi:protein SCO1/2